MKMFVTIMSVLGAAFALAGTPASQHRCCGTAAEPGSKGKSCCMPDSGALPDHCNVPKEAADADASSKAKPYPLTTCIVSDEKLGAMGDPVSFTCKDQEIKLCCKSCRKKFDKDPAGYLKKLAPKN